MTVLAGFTTQMALDPVLGGELTRSKAQSLVECAVLAYRSREEVDAALKPDRANGTPVRFEWFEAVGRSFDSQAFACVIPGHVILAFRGTKQLRDFLTDALVIKKPLKDFDGTPPNDLGLVHLGFQHSLNSLWSDRRSARRNAISTIGDPLDTFLREVDKESPQRQLWLTGHSLGAALATIAAARIQLTDGAPFKGRVGALVTIGSPRALDNQAADKLRQALGSERICRIHRSIDPVPAVPYRGFRHVSGRKAFVTRQGRLVMGARKTERWADRFAATLRTMEDSVGSALPGQHRGFGGFVSDHASEDYLSAVKEYKETNQLRIRDSIAPIAFPLMKLVGVGAGGLTAGKTVADVTGISGPAGDVATAVLSVLSTGAEAMLALMF